jgi:hypothetical protein
MIGEVIPRFLYIVDTAMACTSVYRARLPPRRGFADNYRNNNNNNNNLRQNCARKSYAKFETTAGRIGE